jgi:dTDP-4-dehydrorhamnose 3,5-epimerase
MNFIPTPLGGATVIELAPQQDERGFFARAWCAREFAAHGLNANLAQANLSNNRRAGTLRGLHYQIAPYEEAKLVRCTRGAFYDVIVDVRPSSPTFLEWFGIELTAANRKMLYVPEGFAHGLQTLEDDTDTFYQVSQFYTPHSERGIRWGDPALGIEWPRAERRLISAKDASWPTVAELQIHRDPVMPQPLGDTPAPAGLGHA